MGKVFFEDINGKKVFCSFSEPKEPSKKIVIMSHGFRGTSIGPARQFVDFQRILNEDGYAVLRFDQPNSGNSEGAYIDSSFNEWINTIVYLANKYLDSGYEVNLLGQSMGATATTAATCSPEIKNKIPCILLWVPDAKADIDLNPEEVFEEGGQKYKGRFWTEARDSNFFECLSNYQGKIHLVYGETDKYVKKEFIEKTIQIVKDKGYDVMVLKGQDHSPWDFDLTQDVYKQELAVLAK